MIELRKLLFTPMGFPDNPFVEGSVYRFVVCSFIPEVDITNITLTPRIEDPHFSPYFHGDGEIFLIKEDMYFLYVGGKEFLFEESICKMDMFIGKYEVCSCGFELVI